MRACEYFGRDIKSIFKTYNLKLLLKELVKMKPLVLIPIPVPYLHEPFLCRRVFTPEKLTKSRTRGGDNQNTKTSNTSTINN